VTKIAKKKHPHAGDMDYFMRRPSALLSGFKRFYEAGVPEALHSALYICNGADRTPEWVVEGAYEIVSLYFKGEAFDKRRTIKGKRRKLDTMKAEFIRWAVVVNLNDAGVTLDKAFEAAVEELNKHGTHQVASSTVRAAYKRVDKELKNEETARLYFVGLPPTKALLDEGIHPWPDGD